MSLRSGKEYKSQARMSETEEAASRNSVANESVSVADLLKLLMEERKLRAEEEQRRAVREQETREAERRQREEEKQREQETREAERRQREEEKQREQETREAERRQREEEKQREQETREAERRQREEEKQRQAERERQARDEWKAQFEMVARLAQDGRNREGEQTGRILKEAEAKVAKLTERDDIEAYLATFERTMTAYEVNRQRWVYKLAPQLSGKAQQAYAAMSSEEAVDYERVKAAILKRYDINEETYRLRFRSVMKSLDESHREVAVRVKDLAKKWLKQQATAEAVVEVVAQEQLLNTLPSNVRVWVRERKPTTCLEAGQLADDYAQARRQAGLESKREDVKNGEGGKQSGTGGQGKGRVGEESAGTRDVDGKGQPSRKGPRCYSCHKFGHIASKCPSSAVMYGGVKYAHKRPAKSSSTTVIRSGWVNDRWVKDIVLDTGAAKTMIRGDLVTEEDMVGSSIIVKCAHGDEVAYPVARVKIVVEGVTYTLDVAVSDSLPVSVLLGRDVPDLVNIGKTKRKFSCVGVRDVMAVTTRAQARAKRAEESQLAEREQREAAVTTEVDSSQNHPVAPKESEETATITDQDTSTREDQGQGWTKECPGVAFDAELFEEKSSPDASLGVNISATELGVLQKADPTLSLIWEKGIGKGDGTEARYFEQKGLLWRRWNDQTHSEEEVRQLVLPTQCRKAVLQLAHEIPLSGHLGKKKTLQRVLQRFYWPSVCRDVANWCRSCAACQKTAQKRHRPAPLVPLPIIEEPFARIAMDIVGPLPRSRSGNKFILVVCDYATRYPEAVAMKSVVAEYVAEELIGIFARVGIPREILTDQGSNFMSNLLSELYRLMQIKPIRTSPYHPETDGLVERFNGTLKAMLRKAAVGEGKDWDKLLPFVLFAYREVPQASTGFSPFELVYGRQVRGPLDILKETWKTSKRSTESVVSYVLDVQEKLARMSELVVDNLKEAQKQQKRWYDSNARMREFKDGDQVLVLLPSSTSKLLASWQGPYVVKKRLSDVTYEVDIVYGLGTKQLMINEQLEDSQKIELLALLKEFDDVLQNTPGKTNLVEYRIHTDSAPPLRLPAYRLPYAYRDRVKKELDDMLKLGIIEPSASEWASPMVVVAKKDGALRICVDFRRLNAISKYDAYPMQRIDELVDKLGKARFVTTVDLTKGYWQVPIAEEDKPKTAFTTPFGLFQFTVMPFGLQGAPSTFQRMMDTLIRGMEGYASAYIDDVAVYSSCWREHIDHLRNLFLRLRKANLKVKPSKCQCAMFECVYLGHVVGKGTVRLESSKIEAIKRMPVPRTKKGVRQFLGLAGYYRRFIRDFATIATPLTELTRKSAPQEVKWSLQAQEAFDTLKTKIASSPVLMCPDMSRMFTLQTDASDYGIGAVLSQTGEDGEEHPVAFFSQKLLPRERKYSTIEKECLAIRMGTQAFRVYLIGKPFVVQTDHRALEWLYKMKDTTSRLTRWSLALQPFQFTVRYRRGQANANADALSRCIVSPSEATKMPEKEGEVSGTQASYDVSPSQRVVSGQISPDWRC
eukprot:Em0003g1643a